MIEKIRSTSCERNSNPPRHRHPYCYPPETIDHNHCADYKTASESFLLKDDTMEHLAEASLLFRSLERPAAAPEIHGQASVPDGSNPSHGFHWDNNSAADNFGAAGTVETVGGDTYQTANGVSTGNEVGALNEERSSYPPADTVEAKPTPLQSSFSHQPRLAHTTWQAMFEKLKDYFNRYGKETSEDFMPDTLRFWLASQIRAYKMYSYSTSVADQEGGSGGSKLGRSMGTRWMGGLKKRHRREPTGIIKTRVRQLKSIGIFDWDGEFASRNREHDLVAESTIGALQALRHGGNTNKSMEKEPMETENVEQERVPFKAQEDAKSESESESEKESDLKSQKSQQLQRSDKSEESGDTESESSEEEMVPFEEIKPPSPVQTSRGRISRPSRRFQEATESEYILEHTPTLKGRATMQSHHARPSPKPSPKNVFSNIYVLSAPDKDNTAKTKSPTASRPSHHPAPKLTAKQKEQHLQNLTKQQELAKKNAKKTKKVKRKGSASLRVFPEVLFKMVNETSIANPHIIEWLPCGSAFKVKDLNLISDVLQIYFRHGKYSSFQRQLNMYGFSKHIKGKYVGAFQHPHFHRDLSVVGTLVKHIVKKSTTEMLAEARNTPTFNKSKSLSSSKPHSQEDDDEEEAAPVAAPAPVVLPAAATKAKKKPASKSKKVKHPKPDLRDPKHVLFITNPDGPFQPEEVVKAKSAKKEKKALASDAARKKKRDDISKVAASTSVSSKRPEEKKKKKYDNEEGPRVDPFPEKLYELVSDISITNPSILSWLPCGEAFVVKKTSPEELGPILLKYFSHDKYSSFQRQLNNYGFKKHTSGKFKGAFCHPAFRRNINSISDLAAISRHTKVCAPPERRSSRTIAGRRAGGRGTRTSSRLARAHDDEKEEEDSSDETAESKENEEEIEEENEEDNDKEEEDDEGEQDSDEDMAETASV